jgi:hypothetical protein
MRNVLFAATYRHHQMMMIARETSLYDKVWCPSPDQEWGCPPQMREEREEEEGYTARTPVETATVDVAWEAGLGNHPFCV